MRGSVLIDRNPALLLDVLASRVQLDVFGLFTSHSVARGGHFDGLLSFFFSVTSDLRAPGVPQAEEGWRLPPGQE